MTTPPGKLRIVPVLRDVLGAYAGHWKLLVPLTMVVLMPQALADAAIGDVEVHGVERPADALELASIPVAIGVNLGGEALLAGIVAAAVVHWRAGERLPSVRTLAGEIPYGRLIAIDLLLVVAVVVGLSLLIVPGIVLLTYFGISPALIELRDLKIREAVRRSFELVRGNFWRVLTLTALVVAATDAATILLESPLHGFKGEALFSLGVEAVVEPLQSLAVVLLALELLRLHGE